jgi:hypothetical protein
MEDSVQKTLDEKPYSPLEDLMEALRDMSNAIADVEPEPSDWAGWITYLLEVLQAEAQRDRKDAAYESVLQELRESLENRSQGGKW